MDMRTYSCPWFIRTIEKTIWWHVMQCFHFHTISMAYCVGNVTLDKITEMKSFEYMPHQLIGSRALEAIRKV